ncbi:serine/threonine protein kinase [Gemmatimonadota bacterium]
MKGKQVGHYQILEKLGAGGMGEVWLAEDTRLERKVALKFLPHHAAQEEAEKARFIQEAKAAARLTHNNIAQIYEIGEEEGRLYIVMEYVSGGSLRDQLDDAKGRSLPLDKVLTWVQEAAQGLAEAHKQGIIHRDIKPDNLMLTESGQVKITDFGLARLETATRLTMEGATLGTVNYMAPEQITGHDVDHRADLFSLGATLYELLTGQRAFEGPDANATYYAILNNDIEPLQRFRTDVPLDLDHIIDKILCKDVTLRYQTAEDINTDIKRLVSIKHTQDKFQLSFYTITSLFQRINTRAYVVITLLLLSFIIIQLPGAKLYTQYVVWYAQATGVHDLPIIYRPLNTLESIEQLESKRDLDAYLAAVVIDWTAVRSQMEDRFTQAEEFWPSYAPLYILKSLWWTDYGINREKALESARTASRIDPNNGASTFIQFVVLQNMRQHSQLDSLLYRTIYASNFEYGWKNYYSSVYRSLSATNALHPSWYSEVVVIRYQYFTDAVHSYLGMPDRNRYADTITSDSELIRRCNIIETIGNRMIVDPTAVRIQQLIGSVWVRLSLQRRMEVLPIDSEEYIAAKLKMERLRMMDNFTNSIWNDKIQADNRALDFSALLLVWSLASIVLLLWSGLTLFVLNTVARPFTHNVHTKALRLVFIVGVGFFGGWFILGDPDFIVVFGICALFMFIWKICEYMKGIKYWQYIRYIIIGITAILILPYAMRTGYITSYVLVVMSVSLLYFRINAMPLDITDRLQKVLPIVIVVCALIIAMSSINLAFQSISFVPELEQLITNPIPPTF